MNTAANHSTSATPRRPRGGRPVVADELARTARVSLACTPGEAAQIHSRARAAGVKASELLRTLALGARLPAAPPPAEWRAAWADLARVNANLNQIAHHLNSQAVRGRVPQFDAELLSEQLADLRARVAALRAALVPTR